MVFCRWSRIRQRRYSRRGIFRLGNRINVNHQPNKRKAMELKTLKQRKCKECKQAFVPKRNLQSVCGPLCAIAHSNKLKSKKERKEYREAKEKIKSRSDWMREAQIAFNSYIRARDKDLPCISSGVMQATWDAGHYRSVGSSPALRFNELNVHKQSVHDNQHLHGNLIEYRKRLIERIGIDKVEWLEGPHEPKKYTIQDLKEIKSLYKQKLKGLINKNY